MTPTPLPRRVNNAPIVAGLEELEKGPFAHESRRGHSGLAATRAVSFPSPLCGRAAVGVCHAPGVCFITRRFMAARP